MTYNNLKWQKCQLCSDFPSIWSFLLSSKWKLDGRFLSRIYPKMIDFYARIFNYLVIYSNFLLCCPDLSLTSFYVKHVRQSMCISLQTQCVASFINILPFQRIIEVFFLFQTCRLHHFINFWQKKSICDQKNQRPGWRKRGKVRACFWWRQESRSFLLIAITAWTQIHEFQPSHEGVREVVSERAREWSEQAKQT